MVISQLFFFKGRCRGRAVALKVQRPTARFSAAVDAALLRSELVHFPTKWGRKCLKTGIISNKNKTDGITIGHIIVSVIFFKYMIVSFTIKYMSMYI